MSCLNKRSAFKRTNYTRHYVVDCRERNKFLNDRYHRTCDATYRNRTSPVSSLSTIELNTIRIFVVASQAQKNTLIFLKVDISEPETRNSI